MHKNRICFFSPLKKCIKKSADFVWARPADISENLGQKRWSLLFWLISVFFYRYFRWWSRTGIAPNLLACGPAVPILWAATQSCPTWTMRTGRPSLAQPICCPPADTRTHRHSPSCCKNSWMLSMRRSGDLTQISDLGGVGRFNLGNDKQGKSAHWLSMPFSYK